MKKTYVFEMKVGDLIDDVFLLINRQIGRKRDGNIFANMTLGDKSGYIKAVMWDNVDYFLTDISVGDFVKINGSVGEYLGFPQLILRKVELLNDEKKIFISDFLPVSGRNIDKMFDRLKKLLDTIDNTHIRKLFELFWEDSSFVESFKVAPAAKRLHHAYIGGLLEHSLSMAIISDKVSSHYSGVDRDFLLAGAVLHDIGKIRELSYNRAIDYTDEGRFLSHIVIGVQMIDEKIKQLEKFPEKIELLLKHLIVSHHGVKEFGSPEVPKTLEAVLLNCIDDMDFRVNSVRECIETDISGESWTSYNRFMERHFYKGNLGL